MTLAMCVLPPLLMTSDGDSPWMHSGSGVVGSASYCIAEDVTVMGWCCRWSKTAYANTAIRRVNARQHAAYEDTMMLGCVSGCTAVTSNNQQRTTDADIPCYVLC